MSAESPEAHAHPAQLRSVHVCTALCHLCVSQSTPVRTRHRGRQIKHKHTQTDRHTKTGKYVSGDKNNAFAIKMTSNAKSSLQASESELRLDTKWQNLCHFYKFLSRQIFSSFILKLRSSSELTGCIWPHVLNHRSTGCLDATSARRGLYSVVDSDTDSCRHHGSAAILIILNNENRLKSAWRGHNWCVLMQSLHRWVWSDGKI